MAQRGNVVHSAGRFSVVEVVETYLDGRREVTGYVVDGPGVDSTWMGSLEEAVAVVDRLTRPRPGPRM